MSRYRWLFILCLLTLGISVGAVGTVAFNRWQADQGAGSDARLILDQAGRSLEQFLHNRRGTAVLLREMLDKSPGLGDGERAGLAKSVMTQTPDVVGSGWMQKDGSWVWWVPPSTVAANELTQLTRSVRQRPWLQALFRSPSAQTVFLSAGRPVWVVMEPMRAGPHRSRMIVAVFDLKILLEDFFKRALSHPVPVRLLDGDRVLYRSNRWPPLADISPKPVIDRRIQTDGVRWSLQMRSGVMRMVPRSWFNVLIFSILLLAVVAVGGMFWTTERLRRLATTDELTGLSNRRFFLERWDEECSRANRYNRALSCLMIDIDGFKKVNDRFGHHAGDLLLQEVAQQLKSHVRRTDLLARFGGDEFIVGLPETDFQQAMIVAQKLRAIPFRTAAVASRDPIAPISLSIGASQMQAGDSPQKVIDSADADLYASRRSQNQNPSRSTISPRETGTG